MKDVLETTKCVIDKGRHVTIDEEALVGFSQKILANNVDIPPWDCHYHYCGDEETMVSYLLVLDTLNFCFCLLSRLFLLSSQVLKLLIILILDLIPILRN